MATSGFYGYQLCSMVVWSPVLSMVTRDCAWLSVIVDVAGVVMIKNYYSNTKT